MAVAFSSSNSDSSFIECSCYKVASLGETILDAYQISNFKHRYRLGEQLGWGQFGVIRACSDNFTGEVLACKSISKDRLITRDDVQSIKLEIDIMKRLSGHPNVVDLKAVYEEEDYVHLVMELCAGGELFHQLEKQGRFSEADAKDLFRHLMQVVMYCHDKGVIHRDLKPENILLATKASCSPIKLADFGLATYIKSGQSLQGTVGSPFYIAPEVLKGSYNQAADVWSAGVILYILLSGMPPFWGKTKSKIFDAVKAADLQFPSDPWDHISDSAKDLIRKMLSLDPSKRLTAQQVLDHTWIRVTTQVSELYACEKQSCGALDVGRGCFSLFMTRSQDISFGTRSPVISDAQSPSLTCWSSFSSFLVEPSTPCFESSGFSFQSNGELNALEFSTHSLSMPSLAFFSPVSVTMQESYALDHSANISSMDSLQEVNLGKLLVSPDSSSYLGHKMKAKEQRATEGTRRGGTTGAKLLDIQSKRNQTIGFGEGEQLDLMVTESVIRWASCTHFPMATSLRSSLVC